MANICAIAHYRTRIIERTVFVNFTKANQWKHEAKNDAYWTQSTFHVKETGSPEARAG